MEKIPDGKDCNIKNYSQPKLCLNYQKNEAPIGDYNRKRNQVYNGNCI